MNSRPALPDHLTDDPALTAEDLQTAEAVLCAFEPVVAGSPAPVPATSLRRDPARERVLAPLAAAPAPRSAAPRPRRRLPRRRLALGVLGTVAAGLTLGAVVSVRDTVFPVDNSVVPPAAAPSTTPSADEARAAAVRAACDDAFEGELGRPSDLQVRGTRALALFPQARRIVRCVVDRDGDRWADAQVSTAPVPKPRVVLFTTKPSGPQAGDRLLFDSGEGLVTLRDGSKIRYVAGRTPDGTTEVTLENADAGEEKRSPGDVDVKATATVTGRTYALWLPTATNTSGPFRLVVRLTPVVKGKTRPDLSTVYALPRPRK